MKKTLAIILTLALVICMMPASAFADGPATNPVQLTDSMISLSSVTEEPKKELIILSHGRALH